MSEEIVPVEVHALSEPMRDPEKVLEAASRAAKALQRVVESNKNAVLIGGKQYLTFECWQTIGEFYRYGVKVHSAEGTEIDGVKGFKARADVIDLGTGTIVGGAESFCMRDEERWASRPSFQLASMAQTRAGSKALRTRLAWVAVLAGYESTPAEEMDGISVHTEKPKRTYPRKKVEEEIVKDGLRGEAKSDSETQAAWNELSDAYLRWKASSDDSMTDQDWWIAVTHFEKPGKDGINKVWEQNSMAEAEAFYHNTYKKYGQAKNVFIWLKKAKEMWPALFEKIEEQDNKVPF